jgi:hypothetical protein
LYSGKNSRRPQADGDDNDDKEPGTEISLPAQNVDDDTEVARRRIRDNLEKLLHTKKWATDFSCIVVFWRVLHP